MLPGLSRVHPVFARVAERLRPWRAPTPANGPIVAIIGAGAAGLASAAMLRRHGTRTVNFDAADHVGGSWPGRYDALRLNTVRWMSDLPGCRMGSGDRWVTRDQMTAYLRRYAAWHRLDIRLGVRVGHIEPSAVGRWRADIAGETREFDGIVVASGSSRDPLIPDWPGRETYGGTLLHSADYAHPAALPAGPVLVVGAGSSGGEIAADLASSGRTVVWSVRTVPRLIPRELLAMPTTPLGVAGEWSTARSVDAISRGIERLAYGRRDYLPEPTESVMALMSRCKEPLTADRIVEFVRDGAVDVVGPVEALTSDGVVLAGGRRIDAPTVIAATGYDTGLRRLVGHLDVLDDNDRPTSLVPRPGLGFVGYRIPLAGTLWAIDGDARTVARELLA